jgi:hypothetical protein
MERLHFSYDDAASLPVVDAAWLLDHLHELDKARNGEADQHGGR